MKNEATQTRTRTRKRTVKAVGNLNFFAGAAPSSGVGSEAMLRSCGCRVQAASPGGDERMVLRGLDRPVGDGRVERLGRVRAELPVRRDAEIGLQLLDRLRGRVA